MRCARCGEETPRLTVAQRYCPPCHRDVTAIEEADAKRRAPRFPMAKDLTFGRSAA
jgi:hypothetical protein